MAAKKQGKQGKAKKAAKSTASQGKRGAATASTARTSVVRKRKPDAVSRPASKPAARTTASAMRTDELLADLPRLTDDARAAFRGQLTDAQCAALGQKTRSALVVREALDWAAIMHAAIAAQPHALRRYGATRLSWFVECVRELERAILAQQAIRSQTHAVGLGVDLARTAAMAVRNDLRETLQILAGADAREKDAVARALESDRDDEGLARSLHALGDLAGGWLARHDAVATTLVASVSLSRGDVESAHTAADELSGAIAADAGAPVDSLRDASAVNVAEGRVLAEMRLARGVFERAHEGNRKVPRLIPGAGTRNVVGNHRAARGGAGDAAATPPPAAELPPAAAAARTAGG